MNITDFIMTETQAKVKDALWCWAEMMKAGIKSIDYPSASIGFSTGGLKMWEELEESVDRHMAQCVEAIMEGMPVAQCNAIHHFHLAAVYKPQRSRIEDDYANALLSVEIGLRKRGML